MMEDGTNWVLDLEEALLDEAPPHQIRMLLAGLSREKCTMKSKLFLFEGRPLPASLRTDVWYHCLEINGKKSKHEKV